MRSPPSLLPCAALFALLACGQPTPSSDAGVEEDAGVDTEVVDAGFDAGVFDAGVGDAGFGPFNVDAWCDMLALAECNRAKQCLSLGDAQWDDCIMRVKSTCDTASYVAGVSAGRLQYLPQEAADCINGYATAGCVKQPEACDAVFQGFVAPDGGCLTADECQAGSYCLTYANTCPYTCHAYRGIGETCNWWERQCDPAVGRCTDVNGTYQCTAFAGVGEACVYFSDCRGDLACVEQKCVKREAKVGEACRESQGYPYCEEDAFCRQEPVPTGQTPDAGVCMRKAALGGVCSGYGTCLTGMRCSSNYATGTCIPLGAVGDTCSNYDDCQQELYCSPPTSRCTELPGAGGDCGNQGSFYRCSTGHFCEYQTDTCVPLKPVGSPCNYDGMCQSGACEYGPMPDGGQGVVCVDACLVRLDGGF